MRPKLKKLIPCILELLEMEDEENRREYVREEHVPFLHTRFRTLESYLSSMNCSRFKEYTRLTPLEFSELVLRIAPEIEKKSTHLAPISVPERVCLFLRHTGHGSSYASLSHEFSMGKSTVKGIVDDVSGAIVKVFFAEAFPTITKDTLQESADGFLEKNGYPRAVAALDGKHIQIKCPTHAGSSFFNYKSFHSIVLLALVDSNYKFIMIDIGGAGRNSDASLFNGSPIKTFFQSHDDVFPDSSDLSGFGNVPYHILVDGGFGMGERYIRPFSQAQAEVDQRKRHFNTKLSGARRIVESAFGIWSRRFRLFAGPVETAPATCRNVALATLVLHNLIANKGDALASSTVFRPVSSLVPLNAPVATIPRGAKVIRDRLVNYFAARDGI